MTLKINNKLIENLLIGESFEEGDDWINVEEEEIVSKDRWSTYYSSVWKNKLNEEYYRFYYSLGSTEYQYNGIENISFEEVYPQTVEIIKFVKKENK